MYKTFKVNFYEHQNKNIVVPETATVFIYKRLIKNIWHMVNPKYKKWPLNINTNECINKYKFVLGGEVGGGRQQVYIVVTKNTDSYAHAHLRHM